jgi:hypothetical protein
MNRLSSPALSGEGACIPGGTVNLYFLLINNINRFIIMLLLAAPVVPHAKRHGTGALGGAEKGEMVGRKE